MVSTDQPVPAVLRFDQKPGTRLTNMFHRYPAMMHTEMLEYLFDRLKIRDGTLLDPFCGTGRSLVCGLTRGCDVFGVDLNPLACIISGAKLACIDPDRVEKLGEKFLSCPKHHSNLLLSDKTLSFWFSKRSLVDLGGLLDLLMGCLPESGPTKLFFYTALSETIRSVSYTRPTEYKLYRMSVDQRRKHRPSVIGTFKRILVRNLAGLRETSMLLPKASRARASIHCGDWLTYCTDRLGGAGRVDFIVTSPPYGDSRTTVAYGEFSRLSLRVLASDGKFAAKHGLTDDFVRTIDSRLLGGHRSPITERGQLPTCAEKAIERVADRSLSRSVTVERFFRGFVASIDKMAHTLRDGGMMIMVLGNRHVEGHRIPLDKIAMVAAQRAGMTMLFRARRQVPYKLLPRIINAKAGSETPTLTMSREVILGLVKR